jgi:hypothetical protein
MAGMTATDVSSKKTSCIEDRLNALGFDWSTGRVILQLRKDGSPSHAGDYLDNKEFFTYKEIKLNNPLISEITADDGGGWWMNGFHYEITAYDAKKIYYTWEYDGSSGLSWKFLNPNDYKNYKQIK